MIGWIFETLGGFAITCFLILLFCDMFGIAIHINLVP